MDEVWPFLVILLGLAVLNHLAELRIRRKILASIEQGAPLGQVELWVRALHNRYRLPIFAIRRDFYAELIFTERAVFIFRMSSLGPVKLRSTVLCLLKRYEDMPKIDGWWFKLQDQMFYKIDSLLIDGRRVMIECSYVTSPNYGFRKIREHGFLIPDLRDNDAYKNVLLLHRYLQQPEQFNG